MSDYIRNEVRHVCLDLNGLLVANVRKILLNSRELHLLRLYFQVSRLHVENGSLHLAQPAHALLFTLLFVPWTLLLADFLHVVKVDRCKLSLFRTPRWMLRVRIDWCNLVGACIHNLPKNRPGSAFLTLRISYRLQQMKIMKKAMQGNACAWKRMRVRERECVRVKGNACAWKGMHKAGADCLTALIAQTIVDLFSNDSLLQPISSPASLFSNESSPAILFFS